MCSKRRLNPFSRLCTIHPADNGQLGFTPVPTGVLPETYVVGLHCDAYCVLNASMADSAVRGPGGHSHTITQMGRVAEWCLIFHNVIYCGFLLHLLVVFAPHLDF